MPEENQNNTIKAVNLALCAVYKRIIDKSWENDETFEAYQKSWRIIEEEFTIAEFDWTKGERPQAFLLPKDGDK